jgi:hypothetical protein
MNAEELLTESQIEVCNKFTDILANYYSDRDILNKLVKSAFLFRIGYKEYKEYICRPMDITDGNWWFIEQALLDLMYSGI